MADNSVFISGSASGALAAAFEGLPEWSTEETAKSIEGHLKKLLGVQTKALSEMIKGLGGKGGKPLSPADAKKLTDETAKLIKNFRDLNKEMDKRKKRAKEEEEQHNSKKQQWDKEKEIESQRLALGAMFVKLGNNIKETMISNVSIFDQLYASGINVVSGFDSASNGFDALRQLSETTGARFTELAASIIKYNAAINNFGLENFGRTIKGAKDELTGFGYGTKEAGELLGAYLESQRGFADSQNRTQQAVEENLIRFGKRITNVSIATGMLRTQLLANLDAVSKQVEMSVLAGQIGEQAAEQTADFIASFKDQKIGNAFLKMMTDIIKPLNTTFMDFQKIGFGGFGKKLIDFTQSLQGLPAEEAQKRVAEFMQANRGQVNAMEQSAKLLSEVGMREADGALSILAGLKQQERAYTSINEYDREKMRKTSEASKALANAWEEFKAQLQITFAPLPKILEMFTTGLKWLNEGFDTIRSGVTYIEEFINSFKSITDVTGKIDLMPWIGIGLAGVAALASLKMIFGIFTYAFSIFAIKTTTLASGVEKITNAVKWIRDKLTKVGSFILSAGKFIANALKPVGAIILRFAPMLLRLLGPIGLLYTAFQLGSAIGEKLHEMLSEFEWFNNLMDGAFSFIEGIGPTISKWSTELGTYFSAAGKKISEAYDDSAKWVSNKIKSAGDVFSSGSDLISGLFNKTTDAVSNGMLAASDFISNGYKRLMTAIGPKVQTAINEFYDGVNKVKNFFVDIFRNLFTSIGEKFTKWFPWISDVTDFLSSIPNKIKDIFKNMKLFGESYVDALKDFLMSVMKKFADKMIPDFMKFWKKDDAKEEKKVDPASKENDQKAIYELVKGLEQQTKSFQDIRKSDINEVLKNFEQRAKIYKEAGIDTKKVDELISTLKEKAKTTKEQEPPKVEPQSTKISGVVSLPELKTPLGASRLSAPKPSELNSPSEISTKSANSDDKPISAKKTEIPSGTGLRDNNNEIDINMAIRYQTAVLEQILQSTNSLVSVNQDILKYSKVNT